MSTDVRYRAMDEGDEEAAVALVLRGFDEFVRGDCTNEGAAAFERAAREFIVERPAGHVATVAEDGGGHLLGVIDLRDRSHVALFFVDAGHQRTGIGRGLLEHALEGARQQTPDLAAVTVNSSPWAVSVYERLGFVAAGAERELNGIRFVPMTRGA